MYADNPVYCSGIHSLECGVLGDREETLSLYGITNVNPIEQLTVQLIINNHKLKFHSTTIEIQLNESINN